jgi:hypothetical protein
MNVDGSTLRNLSQNDYWYCWSPDSTQIFLASTLDPQNQQLSAAIVNVDGSGRREFTFGSSVNWVP